jgi:hypothetical protein
VQKSKKIVVNQSAVIRKVNLQEFLFSYKVLVAGYGRYLLREIKVNPYYDVTFYVNNKKVALVLVWLRDDSLEYMRHLIDLTCVDHIDRAHRFNI